MHRTLILTMFFPPRIGGAERAIGQLVSALDAASTVVVAPPSGDDQSFDRSVPYRIIRRDLHAGPLRPGWLFHLPWLLALIRRERITRIVCPHYGAFVGAALLLRLMTGCPYIVGVLGLDLVAYRRTFLRRTFLRWNLRLAEWVFSNSEPTRQLLLNFGVPLGKTFVSNPGITVRSTPPSDALNQFRRHYGLVNRTIVLTVGRLVKRKGHARMLRALPEIRTRYPNLLYLIVGDGPERRPLEALTQSLGLSESVRFTGTIDEASLPAAYASADVFTMLPISDDHDVEGFGMVLAEAQAAGLPVVATRSGGVTDVIDDGRTGLLLDERADTSTIAATMIEFLGDPPRRARLAALGQSEAIAKFSIARQAAPILNALRRPPDRPRDPPTVSVIVPVWNDAASLVRTLHRIALQTYLDHELIVVDDGSRIDVAAALRLFPHIRLITQTHAGAPTARNRGFRESRGRYVLFCDADVQLHPRMLERMVTTLELHPRASYAYCSFRFGWRTFDLFDFNGPRLRRSNYISTMSLIRREHFPGFDESLTRLQDWDLWLTMLERGRTGVWVPARLFSASVGKRNISRKIQRPPRSAVEAIRSKHQLT